MLYVLDILHYDNLVDADDYSRNIRDDEDDDDEEESKKLFLFVLFFLQNMF